MSRDITVTFRRVSGGTEVITLEAGHYRTDQQGKLISFSKRLDDSNVKIFHLDAKHLPAPKQNFIEAAFVTLTGGATGGVAVGQALRRGGPLGAAAGLSIGALVSLVADLYHQHTRDHAHKAQGKQQEWAYCDKNDQDYYEGPVYV